MGRYDLVCMDQDIYEMMDGRNVFEVDMVRGLEIRLRQMGRWYVLVDHLGLA
jgi:hypothetical protein